MWVSSRKRRQRPVRLVAGLQLPGGMGACMGGGDGAVPALVTTATKRAVARWVDPARIAMAATSTIGDAEGRGTWHNVTDVRVR